MQKAIEFRDVISTEDFCHLRESVGFQKLTITQAERVLSNTSFLVTAVCNGRSVGIVRVLTDTLTDAYITDVIVSPDFQGNGLGLKMINIVLERLKSLSIDNICLTCVLYANVGKEPFYKKIGFDELPNDKYGYGMLMEL